MSLLGSQFNIVSMCV